MTLYNILNNTGVKIIKIGPLRAQKPQKLAFAKKKTPKNRKTLIFHRISTNFFLKCSEFRDKLNAAKIKILAIKGKDLEKSRVMMTSYIIKRYAESERSWNFGIGLKVGYGLYVYYTRDI